MCWFSYYNREPSGSVNCQTCHIFVMAIYIFDLTFCKNPYQFVSSDLPVYCCKLLRPFQSGFSAFFLLLGPVNWKITESLLHFSTFKLRTAKQTVSSNNDNLFHQFARISSTFWNQKCRRFHWTRRRAPFPVLLFYNRHEPATRPVTTWWATCRSVQN